MTKAEDAYAAGRVMQLAVRVYGWCMLSMLPVYFINNYLIYSHGWPGIKPVFFADKAAYTSWLQLAFYGVAIVVVCIYVFATSGRHLRDEAGMITRFNAYLTRAAFWAVLMIGIVDATISLLRVEDLLPYIFGDQMVNNLSLVHFRGPYIHIPLMIAGLLIALRTRTLGFHWLALGVVLSELLIVISRFIFSYEQALMGDLVRFWYAALFLFASAYTLIEEGHVRVDVFYAGFSNKTRGFVNAVGTLFMGITLCWVILFVGLGTKASIIYSPVANFETSPSGFGMQVKYLMAAFLGVFAITMLIQFVSYLMEAVADYLEQPGHQDHEASPSAG
ncbi:MAG: TRAP transporter small permease subunit [Alphaproteobacteria bacterium]|nr:MAG: TRAP transporter small permease subunit [Alphaproteobacteria bacterium]